jgi:hypothetical protein
MILSLQEPVQLLIALTCKKHEMMCSPHNLSDAILLGSIQFFRSIELLRA